MIITYICILYMYICTYIYIYVLFTYAQSNCSPFANQCPASPWVVVTCPANSWPSCFFFLHDVMWYGISLWTVKVSCLGSVPSQHLMSASSLNSRIVEESVNIFGYVQQCSATTKRLLCYSLRPNIATDQTLWRENQLCPSLNQDIVIPVP